MARSAECEEGPQLSDGRRTVKVRVILTDEHCNYSEPWNFAVMNARAFALVNLGLSLSIQAKRVTMTVDVNVTDKIRIMAYTYTYAFDPKESREWGE